MANILDILTRARALRQETALNSITPDRAGGIMYDTLILINQMQLEGGSLLISKVYSSVAAMEADTTPTSDLTGLALRPGQLAVIVPSSSSSSDMGSVYRYNEPGSWTLCGKIGGLPLDTAPIQGSSNGITSGAVYTALSTLRNEGYKYMGVATPGSGGTAPGTPNQPVFYIAGPGSYPNFGSITVAAGYLGFIKYSGGSWSVESVAVSKDYDEEISQLCSEVGDLETSSQELEDAVFGELKTLIFTRGPSTAQCNFIQGHIYKCTFARYTPYATESPRSMKLTLSGDGVPSAYIPTESGVELNYGESYYFYSPNDYTGATGYTEGTAEWDIRDITEQFEDVFRMMRDSEYVANGSVQYDSLGLIIQEAVVWSNGCSGVLTRTAFDGDVFEYTKEEVTCVNAVAGKFTYKATFDKSYDEFGNIVNESVTIAKI